MWGAGVDGISGGRSAKPDFVKTNVIAIRKPITITVSFTNVSLTARERESMRSCTEVLQVAGRNGLGFKRLFDASSVAELLDGRGDGFCK